MAFPSSAPPSLTVPASTQTWSGRQISDWYKTEFNSILQDIKMKCSVSVSLVFLQVTARQVKRGMVRSKVKKRSWLVFDNVDSKSQHRAAAFQMLQSSLKQWRFSNQLQGVLMSPQVRFLMFNVTFVTLAMSQSFVSSRSLRVLHQIPVCCNVTRPK